MERRPTVARYELVEPHRPQGVCGGLQGVSGRQRVAVVSAALIITVVAVFFGSTGVATAAGPRANAARIDSVSPTAAARGAEVELRGSGFGAKKVRVWVGGVQAQVLSATGNRAVFRVPGTAPLGSTRIEAANPGDKKGSAPFTVLPAGLANLAATPSSVPAGGVFGLAATPSLAPSGEFTLLVAGEPAGVRARPGGGFVVGAPLFLNAAKWPAPPAGPVDLLLFRDGVAVGFGRRALTVTPLKAAPGSAGQARQALDGIVGSFGRIGEALADEPGEQGQWLTGLSAALEELVNGSDPRSLAGALAAADPAQRRLLDAWFASSGMLDALRQYEGMIAEAAAGFKQGGAALGLSRLRALASASPGPAARAFRALPASNSFPTDLELSEAMQFYETVKDFGETFVAATNTQFNLYVGVAAGAIGLVRGVPAVAIITAVIAVADFAINKLFIALLPANIDRFELTLASVLLDPGETTDAVLHLDAVNDAPPIGVQDVIGTILSVMGVSDAPAIQSLKDALLQTANYMLGLVQAAISAYAGEHPELQLNTSIGSIPAMRWQTTVTNPALVDRNSNTRAIIQGLPDQVDWIAQTGPDAHGRGEIFATTVANAFGDDFRNSNIVIVTVEGVQVAVNPASVILAPGGSQQFTATVTNAANTAVTWTATGGAVDPQGFYIAGNTPGNYTVTATSVENPAQSGTASVTVQAQIAVAVSPTTVTLTPGQTRQFSSTVTGTPNAAVTWTATGGMISQAGLYTAGATLGSFSVTATSVEDPTVSASATVRIEAVTCPAGFYGLAGHVTREEHQADPDGFSRTSSAAVDVTLCFSNASSPAVPQTVFVAQVAGAFTMTTVVPDVGGVPGGTTTCSGEFALAVPKNGGGQRLTRYAELVFDAAGIISSGKLHAASLTTCHGPSGTTTGDQDFIFDENGSFHVVQNGRIVAVDFNQEDPGFSVTTGVLLPV